MDIVCPRCGNSLYLDALPPRHARVQCSLCGALFPPFGEADGDDGAGDVIIDTYAEPVSSDGDGTFQPEEALRPAPGSAPPPSQRIESRNIIVLRREGCGCNGCGCLILVLLLLLFLFF